MRGGPLASEGLRLRGRATDRRRIGPAIRVLSRRTYLPRKFAEYRAAGMIEDAAAQIGILPAMHPLQNLQAANAFATRTLYGADAHGFV